MFASVNKASFSNHKTLSEPLLDLDDTEVSYDGDDFDEEIAITEVAPTVGSRPFVDNGSDGNHDPDRVVDSLVVVLVLPVLLLVQFGLNYQAAASSKKLQLLPSPATTVFCVASFALASVLYKNSLRWSSDYYNSSPPSFGGMVVHLLPELWANAVLATIVVTQNLSLALQLLLAGNCGMALYSIWQALRACYQQAKGEEEDEKESDICKY